MVCPTFPPQTNGGSFAAQPQLLIVILWLENVPMAILLTVFEMILDSKLPHAHEIQWPRISLPMLPIGVNYFLGQHS